MADWKDALLCSAINCSYDDLTLLEDCKYDFNEMIAVCIVRWGGLNFNTLTRVMFDFGLRDIEQYINDRICELEAIANERQLDEDEEFKLEALRKLNPFVDINSVHNCIDTTIWIDNEESKKTYAMYLSEALDHFYEMTGFEITC